MAQEGTILKEVMPEDVRSYLLDNPDFLEYNSDILANLVPPEKKQGEKVEDFQHYMLSKIQNDFLAIKGEHDDLLYLMQQHFERQNRINAVILSLLDVASLEEFLTFMESDFLSILDQQGFALFLETGGVLKASTIGSLQVIDEGFIDYWLGDSDIDLCEQNQAEPYLFGGDVPRVKSRALVRLYLGEGMPDGMLVLGHRDPMYYGTGLATEQVEMLGAVIERCISQWLTPETI